MQYVGLSENVMDKLANNAAYYPPWISTVMLEKKQHVHNASNPNRDFELSLQLFLFAWGAHRLSSIIVMSSMLFFP
jgi:hypothetical protein